MKRFIVRVNRLKGIFNQKAFLFLSCVKIRLAFQTVPPCVLYLQLSKLQNNAMK